MIKFRLYFDKDAEKPDSMFFRARMENGIIVVPPRNSEEVLR